MAGKASGAGEVGDLVVQVAAVLQHLRGCLEHARRLLLAGKNERPFVVEALEGGPLFHRKGVSGDVLRCELDGTAERGAPLLQRLPGEGVHEIYAQVVEPGTAGLVKCRDGLLARVHPAEHLQQALVEGLYPQREPVHPRSAIPRKPLRGDRTRVRLQGNLCVGCKAEAPRRHIDDPSDLLRRHERWSATAEIQCRSLYRFRERRMTQLHLAQQKLHVTLRILAGAGGGIEVAVEAFFQAEREMYVQASSHAWALLDTPANFLAEVRSPCHVKAPQPYDTA